MSRESVRVLHCSDFHLGASQEKAERILGAVIDTVRRARPCVCVLTGDIFDSNRVSTSIIDLAGNALRSVDIPVVILPGNHDCYDGSSVYRMAQFYALDDRVRVLGDPLGQLVSFPDLPAVLWGRPVVDHDPSFRPLEGLPSRMGDAWHIALGHGDVRGEVRRYTIPSSSPIDPEEIERSDWDYIALGHWDAPTDVSRGVTTAWYCGAPTGDHVGLIVTLGAGGVRVDQARHLHGGEETSTGNVGLGSKREGDA